MKSVIFDFNGTLFNDSHLHEKAWNLFIQDFLGKKISPEEFSKIHGRTNQLVLESLMEKELSKREIERLSSKKEATYRELVLRETNPKLIDGVTDYFDFLIDHSIPMNIATASEKDNLDFYFDIFKLDKWFDYSKIVYNDGTLNSKPAPDYYIKAFENVGATVNEMIVFEDSPIGLLGAKNANANKIVAVATDNNHEKLKNDGIADFIIDDFTDLRIQKILK